MGAQKNNFSLLDGLRGVAAISVVFYHSCEYLFGVPFAKSAHLAVDFFFLLSGFVIAHAYDGWSQGVRALMLVRLIRLYPLYLVGAILGLAYGFVAFVLGKGGIGWRAMICATTFNAFMLPTPCESGGAMFPFNPPAWSLFYEMVVSLIFAFGAFRKAKVALVVCMLSLLILISGVWQFNGMGFGWQKNMMHLGFAKVCFSFALGLLVRRRLSMGSNFVPFWLPVVILLASFWMPLPTIFKLIFEVVFVLFLSPLVVWMAVNSNVARPEILARILSTLGSMSYAMYITHLPLMFLFGYVGHKFSVRPLLVGGAYIVFVMVSSVVLDKYFDQPVRAWLRRKTIDRY
jgi:peptidoglycan/LPS O-acetylase OafA/YrhL